jgi:hypothetical protein
MSKRQVEPGSELENAVPLGTWAQVDRQCERELYLEGFAGAESSVIKPLLGSLLACRL